MRREFQQKAVQVFDSTKAIIFLDELIDILNQIRQDHGNIGVFAMSPDSKYHVADQVRVIQATSDCLDGENFVSIVNKRETEKAEEEDNHV